MNKKKLEEKCEEFAGFNRDFAENEIKLENNINLLKMKLETLQNSEYSKRNKELEEHLKLYAEAGDDEIKELKDKTKHDKRAIELLGIELDRQMDNIHEYKTIIKSLVSIN